jgi:hypothetical protein
MDEPETIKAVVQRAVRAGRGDSLEDREDFPRRVLDAKPDFVFNIAEGLTG